MSSGPQTLQTDDLIKVLAAAQGRQPRGRPWAAMSASLAAGLVATLMLMAATLGIRPALAASLTDPVAWLKLGFSVLVLLAAGKAAWRLSFPGKGWSGAGVVLLVVFAVVACWALVDLASRPVAEWAPCIVGRDWLTCLVAIPLLALPPMLAMGLAMRRLAPTRLDLAGTLLGLASGGAAAFAFTLYCQDDTASFVAVWYGLALGASALLGRVLGPKLLRW